jgi:protein phosphatase
MSLAGRRPLQPGDVLLLCSDGFWSGLTDAYISGLGRDGGRGLREMLAALGERAVQTNAPFADNTTAAAIRWLGP